MYNILCFLSAICIITESANRTSFQRNGIVFQNDEKGTYSVATNDILILRHGAIADIEDAVTIYLMEEDFTEMEPGTFQNLPKLENLIITMNNVPKIKAGIFNSLTNLTKLDLSANHVSQISSNAFENMTNLEKLDLSNNQLTDVDIHWFQLMPSLKMINIAYNSLTEIPGNIFANLKSQGPFFLLFDKNNITKIDVDAFEGLGIISVLSFDDNGLETLNGDFLHDLEIDRLLIKDNQIKCIDHEHFSKVFVANTTEISGNPWKTKCFTEIETWTKEHHKDVVLI